MTPKIVGVIASRADLRKALQMRKPPDFFEVRLDQLVNNLDELNSVIARLSASLIFTARHPLEGGKNNLTTFRRRDLLLKFLPAATLLDVELRSANSFRPLLRSAGTSGIGTIISLHDFDDTPSSERLDKMLAAAHSLGANIFKVATRTDTPDQFDRLLRFFERQGGIPTVVAMGIGKLGRRSRLALARRGCALNYGHLGTPATAGQLSICDLRRTIR
jgi:3-dehydroquinate dehydratase type I